MVLTGSLADAIRAGYDIYDRTQTGYIMRKRTEKGWVLALLDIKPRVTEADEQC